MKHREGTSHEAAAHDRQAGPARRKGHRWRRRFGIFLLVLAALAVVGRLMLPGFARDYVNRTLDRNPLYAGDIGEVQIHLWRGAYSIHDIRISKTTGNVPVPFFAATRVDFAIQWNALMHRKIVGRVLMDEPEMNFVDGGDEGESQTGAGGPWLQIIKDLSPFQINRADIQEGSVHFRTYKKQTPVDVYLTKFNASIDNLGNIRDETNPLVSTVRATGVLMDQARVEYMMTLDPFSYRPTFHMALRVLGLDVTTLNDFAKAYGKFDFERGWFDLVVETDAKEGQLTGYAKPLFRDLKVFSVTADLKDENVLEYFWQALVGGTTSVLKNHPRDQFGTLIPFSGNASHATTADILATVGNVLRNTFVRAYLPRLEPAQQFEGIQFEPPEFAEMIAVGGAL